MDELFHLEDIGYCNGVIPIQIAVCQLPVRGDGTLKDKVPHESDILVVDLLVIIDTVSYTHLAVYKRQLNNSTDDASFLREYLGYEDFRQLGMDVPYVNFCNVYINGELLGLYIGVESVDNSFLDRAFGTHQGNLYTAEVGATLEPDMDLDLLEQKKGQDVEKSDLKELIEILEETEPGQKGELESLSLIHI